MGGKSSTSTSSVSIPPEVLARYNSVNAQAQQAASTPFEQYSNNPNAFVAPVTATQQAGINNVNAAAGTADPYFQGAANLTTAAAQNVDPAAFSAGAVNYYMSPYVQDVVQSTLNAQQQQNALQRTQLQGDQIKAGAFGNERGQLAEAALAGQQDLANQQTITNLYNQAYTQGLGAFQQQQGVNLAAGQANSARALQAGQQLAGLGAGLQSAQIQGGQAQLQAGNTEQQTTQAGLSALYNQFLQQQGYPFQTTQFLANVAEGTGSLTGSTTSTTQPSSFFSDRRLKHDIEKVGKANNGLNIYKFRYKHDPDQKTQVGLMADEVQKKHPEAVGTFGGFKTVDYDKALREKHAAGGHVGGFAYGGATDDDLIRQLLVSKQNQSGGTGLYGGAGLGSIGRSSYVPSVQSSPRQLMVAQPVGKQQPSGLSQLASDATNLAALGKGASSAYGVAKDGYNFLNKNLDDISAAKGGRINYDNGGALPYEDEVKKDEDYFPTSVLRQQALQKLATANPSNGNPQNGPGNDLLKATQLVSGAGAAASGLGDLFGLFAFKDGGAVRRGYDDGGDVQSDSSDDSAPDDTLARTKYALAQVETGGQKDPYRTIGPTSTKGDRPYGKWQVMGANIPQWTQEALGKSMTPQEFLASPEAQEAVADHHVGKYLDQYGNPQDVASMWLSGHPRATAGNVADVNGTTVPKYLTKFNQHYSNYNNDNPADVPAQGSIEARGEGDPSQNSSSGGLGSIGNAASGIGDWFNRNQNWMVPVLKGLGAMASSNSRYAGSAILQGLGAGAGAYTDQEKAQAEIAKSSLGLAQGMFSYIPQGPDRGKYFNNVTGTVLTQDQVAAAKSNILKNSGSSNGVVDAVANSVNGPRPATINRDTTPLPAGGSSIQTKPVPVQGSEPAPSTQSTPASTSEPSKPQGGNESPVKGVPIKVDDTPMRQQVAAPPEKFANAQDQDNPIWLKAQSDDLRRGAQEVTYRGSKEQADGMLALAEKYLKRADDIDNGVITPRDKNNNPIIIPEIQQNKNIVATNASAATQAQEQKNERNKQLQEFQSNYTKALTTINSMSDLYQKKNPTKLAPTYAEVAGVLSSLPGTSNLTPESFKDFQRAYEIGTKDQTIEAFQKIAGEKLQRAPGAALKAAVMAVANPTMTPEARYNLITQAKAELYSEAAKHADWNESGRPDVTNFDIAHNQTNRGNADYWWQKAVDETPYYAGMTENGRKLITHHRSDDPLFQRQGGGGKQDQIPVVTNPTDAAKLPSGTVFKTPDGRMKRVP